MEPCDPVPRLPAPRTVLRTERLADGTACPTRGVLCRWGLFSLPPADRPSPPATGPASGVGSPCGQVLGVARFFPLGPPRPIPPAVAQSRFRLSIPATRHETRDTAPPFLLLQTAAFFASLPRTEPATCSPSTPSLPLSGCTMTCQCVHRAPLPGPAELTDWGAAVTRAALKKPLRQPLRTRRLQPRDLGLQVLLKDGKLWLASLSPGAECRPLPRGREATSRLVQSLQHRGWASLARIRKLAPRVSQMSESGFPPQVANYVHPLAAWVPCLDLCFFNFQGHSNPWQWGQNAHGAWTGGPEVCVGDKPERGLNPPGMGTQAGCTPAPASRAPQDPADSSASHTHFLGPPFVKALLPQ